MNFNEFLGQGPGNLMSEYRHVMGPLGGGILPPGCNHGIGIAG